MAKSDKPVRTFRIGAVSASVFRNEGEARTFHTVSLQRAYKDGDQWRHSSTLTLSDLPSALRVLELSLRYLEEVEACSGGDG